MHLIQPDDITAARACQERGAEKILLFWLGFIPDTEKQRQLFPSPHQKHRGGGEADRFLLRPDALPDCLIGLGLQAEGGKLLQIPRGARNF